MIKIKDNKRMPRDEDEKDIALGFLSIQYSSLIITSEAMRSSGDTSGFSFHLNC